MFALHWPGTAWRSHAEVDMQSLLVSDVLLGRRAALRHLAALAVAGGAAAMPRLAVSAGTRPLDFSSPVDNLYAFGKLWAGYESPVIGAFHGLMYARIPGRRLMPLFGYTGTGLLFAKFDPAGTLAIKSRETGYFTDLRTGDILETWDNPFTGETVEVYHFYNDLVAGKLGTQMPTFQHGQQGDAPTLMNEGTIFPDENGEYPFRLPFQQYGDDLMLSWDYAHQYTNPVTPRGWPGYSTGEQITPSEHFTFNFSRRQLEDRDAPSVRFTAGFSRLSEAWPFMRMGAHEYRGLTLFGRMFSHKGLAGYGDVPAKVLAYVEKNAPEYLTLPDTWESPNRRVETWGAFAMDVPPENPDYAWTAPQRGPAAPPTGLGARAYRDG